MAWRAYRFSRGEFRGAICLTLAILAAAPPQAFAQVVADHPPESDRVQARALRDAAFEALGAGRFAEGIEGLEAAYALVPNPGLLLNIAIAQRKRGGHCRQAFEAQQRFEAACARFEEGSGEPCPFAEEGETQRIALATACASQVRVSSAPERLPVFVDGSLAGHAPLSLRLPPGMHFVSTSSTGPRVEIALDEGRPMDILLAIPSPAPPERLVRDLAWMGVGLGAAAMVTSAIATGFATETPGGGAQDRHVALAVGSGIFGAANLSAALWVLNSQKTETP